MKLGLLILIVHEAHQTSRKFYMSRTAIAGWVISLLGIALWMYGYFATGNPSLVNWSAITPSWISDFLPNIESEIGMVLAFAGMIPIYWPSARRQK